MATEDAIYSPDDQEVDLRRFVRPGDAVWLSQGIAEPLVLSNALVRQRADIGPCSLFVGMLTCDTFRPEHADKLAFQSYGGIARNHRLVEAGALDVLPSHYSRFPSLIESGRIPCDVVMLQLSAEGVDGRFSLGIAHDYLMAAARRARVVIAEVNEEMPWTYGSDELAELRIDAVFRTSRPLPEMARAARGATEQRIAANVAGFVEDRATLEIGFGALADAVLDAVADRRDLGVHTGIMGEGVVDLIERGVVTNAYKTVAPGMTTTGLLFGCQRANRFARENRALDLRGPEHTHGIATLAKIDNFIAINGAIEVDLTGQVNAELLDGRYVGAVGGQVDFIRGAGQSRGGRSIIAMPSTAGHGTTSRIVSKLAGGVVTTPRSDADLFVTEWGSADLRGLPLAERARRMIAIAHPLHRETLERSAFGAFA